MNNAENNAETVILEFFYYRQEQARTESDLWDALGYFDFLKNIIRRKELFIDVTKDIEQVEGYLQQVIDGIDEITDQVLNAYELKLKEKSQ